MTCTLLNHARKAHGVVFPGDEKKKKAQANSVSGHGYCLYKKDDLKQAKAMITEGVIDCIIEDGRPFRFAEGTGFGNMAKSLIDVSVLLKKAPSDAVVNAI
eukprot:1021025_1